MDRAQITRRDFPTGRRGYEPSAVDEHLRHLADEMDRLRERATRSSRPALAAGASEQVRSILEAAERSAAELREQGGREAAEHVARVEAATAGMLGRLDDLERELGGLIDALRRSGERLRDDLGRLRADVARARPEEEEAASQPPVAAAAPGEEAGRGDDAGLGDDTGPGDEAGARLIALNMALGGTPREETARYLAEHFSVADANALLDEVYARAGR